MAITEFETILKAHQERYPRMEPRDYGKLAYQSEFGAEHLITDEQAMLRRIREEWDAAERGTLPKPPENIGGGLCRFYMNSDVDKDIASAVLVKLFCLTAKNGTGSMVGLEKRLACLEKMDVPGMKDWLEDYRAQGCPAVSHSEQFRAAYAPHYRLLKQEYARFFQVLLRAAQLARGEKPAVIAIDGRCGSGKTSLAQLIAQVVDCNVFHMDDFYLPAECRADNWMEVPGGNMDLARFGREVLEPVFAGKEVLYRPYDCSQGRFRTAKPVPPKKLTVVEGSYSHHPDLNADYDLKLFLTCEKEEQLRRLKAREGDYFPTFERVWMPLEEQYIRRCGIENSGAVLVDTGSKF